MTRRVCANTHDVCEAYIMKVHARGPFTFTPVGINLISPAQLHARPMGRTCRLAGKIKKKTHAEQITALFLKMNRTVTLGSRRAGSTARRTAWPARHSTCSPSRADMHTVSTHSPRLPYECCAHASSLCNRRRAGTRTRTAATATYVSRAVQFHPDGGQSDFARPSARTPHGAYV